jgi:hypothetical protein
MNRAIALILLLASTAAAQTLEIGRETVTRKDTLHASLKLPAPAKEPVRVRLTWTDTYGRVVADETQTQQAAGDVVPVALPLRRAISLQNFLEAEVTVGGRAFKTPRAGFVVTPPTGWDDYQVIMYYPYRPEQQPALRKLGVTAGQIQNVKSRTPDGAAIWWNNDFRYYCDQMAYDFYAPYHTPALKDKEQRMREAKALYRSDRTRKDAFYRQPCLDDTVALGEALAKVRQVVTAQMRFRPFFYSTDETGVANLAEAWDFCFCPRTLEAMRSWLLSRYGNLEAINREWGTNFRAMSDVVPLSTDEMMKRGDSNYSPWADHRTFMNESFAGALKKASETARSVDPTAIAGIVGGQMPGAFGGYDYWQLSRAIDMIEPYNIGNNRELWRSFAPEKPALTTGFGANDMEIWRLWYQALHGDLGVIIYDEQNRYLDAEGNPTKLGSLVAPAYRELTGGVVKQLHQMERVNDPVAIHYSQPSITAHWMIERSPLGESWIDKRSSHERMESDFLRLRQSVIHLLEDNLLQYYFVSYEQLEKGLFDRMKARVLILPQSIAMSAAECDSVRRFVDAGGTVIADSRTALMDSHCRTLPKGQLDDLFGIERSDLKFGPGEPGLTAVSAAAGSPARIEKVSTAEPGVRVAAGARALFKDSRGVSAVIVRTRGKGRTIYLNAVVTDYHRWRQRPPEGESVAAFVSGLLRDAGVTPQLRITEGSGAVPAGVELHPWRRGDLQIFAIHRNYGLRISELGPTEYHDQKALERPLELTADFGKAVALYDVRRGESLGTKSSHRFVLDRTQPSIFAVLPAAPGTLTVAAPAETRPGAMVEIPLSLGGVKPGTPHVFRVRVTDPEGKELEMMQASLAAPGGQARWDLPFAVNCARGAYTLLVRDIATGTKAEKRIVLR